MLAIPRQQVVYAVRNGKRDVGRISGGPLRKCCTFQKSGCDPINIRSQRKNGSIRQGAYSLACGISIATPGCDKITTWSRDQVAHDRSLDVDRLFHVSI